jgi:hypothetical protein
MIKDIQVHIPTERPMRPVIDASTSLAAAFSDQRRRRSNPPKTSTRIA